MSQSKRARPAGRPITEPRTSLTPQVHGGQQTNVGPGVEAEVSWLPADLLVGTRIRSRRAALGLTLDELAGLIEGTTSRLGEIEDGQARPFAVELFAIARSLDAPLSYFFRRGPALSPG